MTDDLAFDTAIEHALTKELERRRLDPEGAVVAVVIPTDGKPFRIAVTKSENMLTTLQGHVGGWIENVYEPLSGHNLIVNEEGKLTGLPHNELAHSVVVSAIAHDDYISGNAVLLGPVDDDGEYTSLPAESVAYLMA